ncbi:hypothetical protein SPONN_1732 [uncultured Candidatus Thioglobus sp.]|nr:hypothetical protein SPONN_1732 [uncultured Candidatus Thioglobus sp.]
MEIIGLDANILVRFFTGDSLEQTNQVYQIFKKAENEGRELYVSTLVVFELIWVLKSIYKFRRDDILQILLDLTSMPIFKFENVTLIQSCMRDAKSTTFDLSDLLIAHSAKLSKVQSVLTFDKKAGKHPLFKLVSV